MSVSNKQGRSSTNASTNNKHSANKRSKPAPFADLKRQQICDAAARIIYEDGIRDYQKAKQRACETLHIKSNTFLPSNEEIERAVHQRIELFGSGQLDVAKKAKLDIAADMLKILCNYQPRVTQSLRTNIELKNSPLEVHTFSDTAELVSDELNWRGIGNHIIEKRYRYSNSEYINVPLIICQLDDCEVEISVFKERELHRSPVCPTNGKIYQRISLKQLNKQDSSDCV